VSFDGEWLHLSRPITSPAPRAVVTDTAYGDFDLSAELDLGAVLPDLELGGFVVGSGVCPWPSGGAPTSFAVGREGDTLTIAVTGAGSATCKGPTGRVGVALRAPQFGDAVVRKLANTRK